MLKCYHHLAVLKMIGSGFVTSLLPSHLSDFAVSSYEAISWMFGALSPVSSSVDPILTS